MKKRIPFYMATGLLTLMVLATIANSFFNPEFANRFSDIGYPTYLIIPLMVTKAIGLLALWLSKNARILEWTYSGFCFLFLLAFLAEVNASSPDYFSPVIALLLLILSYRFKQQRNGKSEITLESNS